MTTYRVVVNGTPIYTGTEKDCSRIALGLETVGAVFVGCEGIPRKSTFYDFIVRMAVERTYPINGGLLPIDAEVA